MAPPCVSSLGSRLSRAVAEAGACVAPSCPFFRLSAPRRSFWFSGFSTPQAQQRKARAIGVAFASTVFVMPTLCVYFGSTPSLLNWWMTTYRLVEYPPQADRRIIPAILNGREPPAKSEDSDLNTNR
ncbi:hypothetical protein BESB_043930 [Besnoitia besnoiti]|uniref:Transmembrane protein n=1 Tax=Besnoitia besnoiti TaxID=94643 RepID=A0A2A9MIX1_BESBE|nr:hypothetical protein BESB_043930 [Besnoitia besnoiti]PFH36201.1 hypothetical protein BESB_043930 [Besnoitia besnoiti]